MITAGTGGSLDGHGNSVFTATSFELASGTMLTINGDAAGDNVIINIGNCTTGGGAGSVCNFDGTINLVGIAADHVLFNITGSNELKIDGANVAGDFVDVNGQIFVSASTVIGRLYGGDSERFQLVSGVDVNPFGRTPEPAALVLAGTVLLGLLPLLRRRFRRAAPNA
jgi:hypothetical protein